MRPWAAYRGACLRPRYSDALAGVGRGPGERVELGDNEGVAFTDGGEGLVEAGTGAVGAGEAVVQVDAFLRDAELAEPVALGGEVLVVGGAAGVTDQGLGHGRERTFSPRQSGFSPYGATATPQVKVTAVESSRRWVCVGVPLTAAASMSAKTPDAQLGRLLRP
jgi:hypothetical protein